MGDVLEDRSSVTVVTSSSSRYARQLPLIGENGQQRLKESTVLVAGIGGLGGACALYLAAAGVGHLILLHDGVVQLPDLNRQTLMNWESLGRPRVEEAEKTLRAFDPDLKVTTIQGKVGEVSLDPWLKQADLVIDARYDMEERFKLNELCVRQGVPMMEAAMYGWEIFLFWVIPKLGPCLECLHARDAAEAWQPLGFPVLGAVAGAAGAMAASEAVKWITQKRVAGGGRGLSMGTLFSLHLLYMDTHVIQVARNPYCPVCGDRPHVRA
ncbi:ThiF family adenylyltransferase [Kyrpidia sp.]|uniref:HesA/MoeB/ThiF family protein n=1 Tax=Kyrpidia sp. TaxID=2073077 RepID=UPI0025898326|nr:ThiF family adenylyltransferase [Kyrpidia sp.]MCL6574620.1 ThiF family adenylyltransferase [Kyrpidia sp.]